MRPVRSIIFKFIVIFKSIVNMYENSERLIKKKKKENSLNVQKMLCENIPTIPSELEKKTNSMISTKTDDGVLRKYFGFSRFFAVIGKITRHFRTNDFAGGAPTNTTTKALVAFSIDAASVCSRRKLG